MYSGKLTVELLGLKMGHFNFKNLVELDLQNCKIKVVDSLMGNEFVSLQRLNFDDNILTNIDCFASISSLKYISLNRNRIEKLFSFDVAAIPNTQKPFRIELSNLEELYLGGNNVTKIKDLCLYRFRKLTTLHLDCNKITAIEGLEQLSNLKELTLNNNRIANISTNSFLFLSSLRELQIK